VTPLQARPKAALPAPGPLVAGLLALLGLAGTACGAPGLTLAACELEHPLRLTVLPAQCGTLEVAEDPARPAGRHIALRVARVPAVSRRAAPDPVFVLAGGPGAAATSFYASVASVFARIGRERDVVLLDQRGTGGSNRLDCADDAASLTRTSLADIAAGTQRCLAALSSRADVAFYTTALAVADLERVRAALGYGRINLYAASYGTRVAQQYLRRFPQHVRSVILDGVVPVGAALGPHVALDAERALADILARCAGQAPCRAAFGDPAVSYRAVHAALAARAAPVSVPDPAGGARVSFEFGPEQLAGVLRLLSYTPEYAALLPLLLDAGAHADYAPLAAQFLLAERAYGEALATGMHNSVVCAEDVPFWETRAIDRARLAATYMGTAQLDGLATVCRIWPHGPVDADLHAPLTSAVPALILSGSDDPATPPEFAREAARSFAHALTLTLAGFGHGLLTAPCMDRVLAQFVARASVAGLDASCTRRAVPLPFFTSVNGPPP